MQITRVNSPDVGGHRASRRMSRAYATTVAGLALVLSPRAGIGDSTATFDPVRTAAALKPLSQAWNQAPANETADYFKYYGLEFAGTAHHAGTFRSGGRILAAHVFIPKTSRGTVILVHGYYDHAGIHKHVIAHLLSKSFTVAIYDQPGHGLSEGERASIGDFEEYVTAFRDFVKVVTANLPGPYHVAAHSMGCSPVMEHLLTGKEDTIHGIVLIAPLVRSAAWHIAGVGNAVAGWFVDSVPRILRKNSSDGQFLAFLKSDPLQSRRIPKKWVRALRAWNKKIEDYPVSSRKLLVIQGTSDTTVAWRYNVRFIGEKFPGAEVLLIEGGGHQLINESSEIRNRVLDAVSDYLGKAGQ